MEKRVSAARNLTTTVSQFGCRACQPERSPTLKDESVEEKKRNTSQTNNSFRRRVGRALLSFARRSNWANFDGRFVAASFWFRAVN